MILSIRQDLPPWEAHSVVRFYPNLITLKGGGCKRVLGFRANLWICFQDVDGYLDVLGNHLVRLAFKGVGEKKKKTSPTTKVGLVNTKLGSSLFGEEHVEVKRRSMLVPGQQEVVLERL